MTIPRVDCSYRHMPPKCGHCGKIVRTPDEERSHCLNKHPGQRMRRLRVGKRPRKFWWAMGPTKSTNENFVNLGV